MGETLTDNANPAELYDPKNLPADYLSLLNAICAQVSRSAYDERKNDMAEWDGSIFQEFCITMPKKLLNEFKAEFSALTGNKYQTFYRTKSQGINHYSAKAAFCLSAKIQKVPLQEFLEKFIRHCVDSTHEIEAMKEHASTVEKILQNRLERNRKPESNAPSLSIQDQITIKNEIDWIKQKLGFYPYRRENSHLTPPGEYSIALIDAERLLVMAPGHADLTSLKASLLAHIGQTEQSLKLAEEAYRTNRTNPEIACTYASILCECKKFDQALDVISHAKTSTPKHPHILGFRGIILQKLEKYSEAIDELKEAIAQDKNYVNAHYWLAITYYKTGQIKKCKDILQTAISIAPDSIKIQEMMTTVMSLIGDYDDAKRIFLSKDSSQLSKAEKAFQEAIKVFEEGDFDRATDIISREVEQKNAIDPENTKEISKLYEMLANLFETQYGNDPNKSHLKHAREYNQKALIYAPSNAMALFKLAFLCFWDQEPKKSKEYIYQICDIKGHLEIGITRPETLFTHLSNELKENSITDYTAPLLWGLEKYPDSLQITVYLMMEYLDQNDVIEAEKLTGKACGIAKSVLTTAPNAISSMLFYDMAECLIRIDRASSNPELHQEEILSLLDACCSEEAVKFDGNHRLNAILLRGTYLREIGFKNDDEKLLQAAARDFEEVLNHVFRHKERDRWLSFNSDIAGIYGKLWNITNDATYLERKAIHLNDIYEEISIEESRINFLDTLFDLAHCYLEIGTQREDKDYLEKSELAFQYRHDLIDKNTESDLYLESCYFWGLACYRLSGIEFNQELHDRAIDCFENSTRSPIEQYVLFSWKHLGILYHRSGIKIQEKKLIKQAIKACQKAISLAGDNIIVKVETLHEIGAAYHNLGHIGSTLSQYKKAIAHYDAAMDMLESNTDTTVSKKHHATCLRSKGQSLLNIYDLIGRTDEKLLNEAFACLDTAITLADQSGLTELAQEVETLRTKIKEELKGETYG